jgi:carbon storage regulator
MLVFSRKPGEQFLIGDNVVVAITAVTGNRVTVAVQAPRDVLVLRSELASRRPAINVVQVSPVGDLETPDAVLPL